MSWFRFRLCFLHVLVHDHRRDEEQEQSRSTEPEQAAQWEEDRGDGAYEEGREVEEEQVEEQCEETPEEEEVKVEWPTGVPQASEKELAKLSHKEGVRKGVILYPSLSFLPVHSTLCCYDFLLEKSVC